MVKMTVYLPKNLRLNAAGMRRVIENTLTGAAKGVKDDFGITTQTWDDRPRFTIESQPGVRVVSTGSDVYGWVTRGTRPHIIEARNANYLAFRVPSRPKTNPGVIGSNRGSRGNRWVMTSAVHHPGTKARHFETVIKKKWDQELPTILQRAIDKEVSGGQAG